MRVGYIDTTPLDDIENQRQKVILCISVSISNGNALYWGKHAYGSQQCSLYSVQVQLAYTCSMYNNGSGIW